MSMYVSILFGDYCAKLLGLLLPTGPNELLDECHKHQIAWCYWLESDKMGLSGACKQIWIIELRKFQMSNMDKSTVICTALCIISQQSRWNPVKQGHH